jgi:hypothetical protein
VTTGQTDEFEVALFQGDECGKADVLRGLRHPPSGSCRLAAREGLVPNSFGPVLPPGVHRVLPPQAVGQPPGRLHHHF